MEDLRKSFAGKKVLIVGDIMLDSYIFGSVERISPEAPVPVVAIEKRENRPGGAANVAVNIKALGADAIICAIVGNDEEGKIMQDILAESGVETSFIFESFKRKTTAKIRVMSQKTQLLRLDYEVTNDLDAEESRDFILTFSKAINGVDVVIIEDYNKGLLTAKNIPQIIDLCKKNNIPVVVDPKKKNFWEYRNVDLFKPNLKELKEALNSTENLADEKEFLNAVSQMEAKLGNKISFITLSEKGVFIKKADVEFHIPAFIRRIADVSGAGDTVISVAALCLASGFEIEKTALIANLAGGLVCEEPGVVPIDLDKLVSEYAKLNHNHEAI
jgi:rfaE bifunctional protein kinase chain/domain